MNRSGTAGMATAGRQLDREPSGFVAEFPAFVTRPRLAPQSVALHVCAAANPHLAGHPEYAVQHSAAVSVADSAPWPILEPD